MENGVLYPGTLLSGRYLICDAIGKGGFGQTYLAEDHQYPGKPKCVVKQLQAQTNDPEILKHIQRLFKQEAEVLSDIGQLDQIPNLLAHFDDNGEFYLVQEWIDGRDLSYEFQSGQPLSEHYVITILYDLLDVLERVHQKGVIHRDIKPSNIMRRHKDGKIILIDFGAVKDLSHQTTIVRENSGQYRTIGIGTPGFMPGEQRAGNPQLSSDIYAVGMLGIQALTGVKPDELPSDPDTHEVIWQDRGLVSAGMAEILNTMVRYDFRQRYRSAMEAKQALQTLKFGAAKTTVLHAETNPSNTNLPITNPPELASAMPLSSSAVPTAPTQSKKIGRRIPLRAIGWSLLVGAISGAGGTLYAQQALIPKTPSAPVVGGGTLEPTAAPSVAIAPATEPSMTQPIPGVPQTSPNPLAPASPATATAFEPVAVDYTPLQNALTAGQWKIADQITRDLVLSLTGRAGTVLRVEDVEQIPCPDMKQLNQLWGQASQGRFSFRAQQKVWQGTVGKSINPDSATTASNDALMAYVKKVGWYSYNNPLQYGGLTFATIAPKGQLPAFMFLQNNSPSDNDSMRGSAMLIPSLAQRVLSCERQ